MCPVHPGCACGREGMMWLVCRSALIVWNRTAPHCPCPCRDSEHAANTPISGARDNMDDARSTTRLPILQCLVNACHCCATMPSRRRGRLSGGRDGRACRVPCSETGCPQKFKLCSLISAWNLISLQHAACPRTSAKAAVAALHMSREGEVRDAPAFTCSARALSSAGEGRARLPSNT